MTLTFSDRGPSQLPAGGWGWVIYGGWKGRPAQRVPALLCPTCGRLFCLADHVVLANGHVAPSVVCPHACGFHTFVVLA